MRRFLLLAVGLIGSGSVHSADNVFDGIPVHGDIRAVSTGDIRAAIVAVRSEDPDAKQTRIREIRVVNHAKIYLVHTPVIHGSEGRFEAQRIKGQWHSGPWVYRVLGVAGIALAVVFTFQARQTQQEISRRWGPLVQPTQHP